MGHPLDADSGSSGVSRASNRGSSSRRDSPTADWMSLTTTISPAGITGMIREEINGVIKGINVIRGTAMTGTGTKRTGTRKPKWRKKRIRMEPRGSTSRRKRTTEREEVITTEVVVVRGVVDEA